jgi:hypothetical protein
LKDSTLDQQVIEDSNPYGDYSKDPIKKGFTFTMTAVVALGMLNFGYALASYNTMSACF